MKKFLQKIIVYGLLLYALSFAFTKLIDASLRKSTFYTPLVAFNHFKYNNVILGSSKALTGINTGMLSAKTKRKWHNLGMDDTPLEAHLLILKILLAQQVHLDTVLLQYDGISRKDDNGIAKLDNNDYRFFPLLGQVDAVDAYFKKKEKYQLYKYVPILKYSNYNTELLYPGLYAIIKPGLRNRFDENGDMTYPNNASYNFPALDTTATKELKMVDRELIEFFELCKQNNITLLLYTAPVWNGKMVLNDSNGYIEKYNVHYFNASNSFNDHSLFYDVRHLNQSGKDSITSVLASFMLTNK